MNNRRARIKKALRFADADLTVLTDYGAGKMRHAGKRSHAKGSVLVPPAIFKTMVWALKQVREKGQHDD